MHTKKHLIWDWNGTIVDDAWLCHRISEEQLAKHELPAVSLDDWRRAVSFPVVNLYRRLGFDLVRPSLEELAHHFLQSYDSQYSQCQLHLDAVQIMEGWSKRGGTQSILSAHYQKHLERQVRNHPLASFLNDIVGIPDAWGVSKVAVGTAWFARSGLNPKEVLYVGDTVHDAETAEALGVDCVLIANGHQHPEVINAEGARRGHRVYATARELFADMERDLA